MILIKNEQETVQFNKNYAFSSTFVDAGDIKYQIVISNKTSFKEKTLLGTTQDSGNARYFEITEDFSEIESLMNTFTLNLYDNVLSKYVEYELGILFKEDLVEVQPYAVEHDDEVYVYKN